MHLDRGGNGRYTATVPAAELEWQSIEIASHPSGDPGDMKRLGKALKGGLS